MRRRRVTSRSTTGTETGAEAASGTGWRSPAGLIMGCLDRTDIMSIIGVVQSRRPVPSLTAPAVPARLPAISHPWDTDVVHIPNAKAASVDISWAGGSVTVPIKLGFGLVTGIPPAVP